MNKSSSPKTRKKLICAIYTRKSHEEGLDSDFNSLDAQREACEAFITSQRHEGWKLMPGRYDDGGYSGGTMERPGLQKILSDIGEEKIDIVVVYKVDRLTRSLNDFSKMVELFDNRQVSFVSVTQAFNTTTSMGRLTLNVLLSFAQFEREVTGERIRDKIAASKKKGMWMGGLSPLGYNSADKKILINPDEAETVRYIFNAYLRLGSVRKLKNDLDIRGIVSKKRISKSGKLLGGNPIARGALYKILNNPVYLGEIRHKENRYLGEHEAILDQALWEKVQALLKENEVIKKSGAKTKNTSLLAGLLWDERGERLSPSHAVKKEKRYRYYVSRSLFTKNRDDGGFRIPANDIEQIVIRKVWDFLGSRPQVFEAIEALSLKGTEQKRILGLATSLAKKWHGLSKTKVRSILLTIIPRIEIHPDRIDIHLSPARLVKVFEDGHENIPPAHEESEESSPLVLSVPANLKRRGIEMKMIVETENEKPRVPDPALVNLIVRAHAMKKMLVAGGGLSLWQIARREQMDRSYLTRLIRLTFLAPDITKAILEGSQPPDLTTSRLIKRKLLPVDWQEQRAEFGF
ncbi:MAG: recombinase family protein [Nitrospinaceae bacterium]|jgi:site-specific DNA recombinase|nr:recombinase family protein [Nitrospinaceae bacterium]MBT3433239.1 recombinase family protein [Nitrospinaceae bacterium]MBT3820582.1 recombinase family protein [Nitrospinaceae bacterium]MBT4094183.1 recombinase family protein [Nitrospinaceae bacterium]MBT4432613.1 recombinase family protein [Nitrospinaceae bacterium]